MKKKHINEIRPNYKLLKSIFVERGIPQYVGAKVCNLTKQRFNEILNGKGELKFKNIINISELLELNESSYGDIFLRKA